MKQPIRVAILDMYNQLPNQGMRCIKELVQAAPFELDWQVFDVRAKHELPDTSYDLYISSGGPGNPLEGDGVWEVAYFELIDTLWKHNLTAAPADKKYVLFICHSFQMACKHFDLADIVKRNVTSFGVLPVHKTRAGQKEPLLGPLPDPFYAVDSRDYQVIQPRLEEFEEHGATIVALEDFRDKAGLERAIMAVRFSEEFFGTQFHPEADADGMLDHFSHPEKKQQTIDQHGERVYKQMMDGLQDENKIALTYSSLIPGFIHDSVERLEVFR
ncbi:MAG: GMP synthase [Bacteroidota bacterium]